MTKSSVLSVDFGTTKTYFSKCPADDPSPVSIDFGDGRDGVPSAILYREGKDPLVGQTALDEYGEASEAERKTMNLTVNFKPDLARSPEAKKAAEDFLSCVLADARKQNLDMEPSARQVLFGVPSEAEEEYRTALKDTARRGGFGTPTLVDEPKGALLFHLQQRDISVDRAHEGVLVADFGGGTCDFAFLEGGEVLHSWGNMLLGGRLFDDLFFQWLLDQNPGLEERLRKRGDAYFVLSHLCREGKEFFSRSMARDRTASVSKVCAPWGKLTDLTWEKFVERGRAYAPSSYFRSMLQGVPQDELEGPLDLFGWFRRTLAEGLKEKNIAPGRISLVILAGGSSLWPFVADILNEEIPRGKGHSIVRSDRPYAVISMGIALFPALKKKFARTRRRLKEELSAFLEEEIAPILERRCETVKKKFVSWAIASYFTGEIRPLLEDFRKSGGTLSSLRSALRARITGGEPLLRANLEKNLPTLLSGLREETKELMSRWFAAHGIILPSKEFALTMEMDSTVTILSRLKTPGVDDLLDVVTRVLGGIITAGTALLCGGTGTALIAAGPVGLAVGGVLGLAISWLIARYGKEKVKSMTEEIELPPWIASFLLDEGRIRTAEKELKTALEDHLEARLCPVRRELEEHVRSLVLDEMAALSEVSGF